MRAISGLLFFDEKHSQYAFLRIAIDDINGEEFCGRILLCGNGRTAYDWYLDVESKEDILRILDNLDEYLDFERF